MSIAAERGRFVVVYFYPRDETPGCTKEACAFRDAWTRLEEGGITVIGVSSDDAASHAEFAALTFARAISWSACARSRRLEPR